MKTQGFTLIELLAVIVILAIIALIAVPIILNIINDSKKSSTERSAENYIEAIEVAITNKNLKKKFNPSSCEIKSDGNLICDGEELKVDVKGQKPSDGLLAIENGKVIDYTFSIGNYGVDPKENKTPLAVLNGNLRTVCEMKSSDTSSNIIVDVVDGLLPVIYEDDNWKVADTTKKWYDYSNQEWANAVILNSGVTKSTGDIVDVTSEVKAMLVYIPRYEYKIEGQYGKCGTSATSPGEIEVNFISKSKTSPSYNYRVHPAFTFGSVELNGIWVGKFETTGTGDSPTILPGVTSLRNQNISTHFATAQKFNSYVTNGDSHMMKNSEWGAVAYLSQSKYGKYGNSMYTGANKEVYQNKSDSYITGSSNGTPGTDTTNTQCAYNDLANRGSGTGSCGGGASTTGNITGVYDMSGGAWEYVMGYLATASSTWGAASSGNNAGFTSEPNDKYFDAYISEDVTTACNGGICYGQALSETLYWYIDNSVWALAAYPWFVRGSSNYSSNAGVFIFNVYSGTSSLDSTFRVVISQTTS